MKKLLCLVLAICLSAGLCACSLSAPAHEIAMQKLAIEPEAETPTIPSETTPNEPANPIVGNYIFHSIYDGTTLITADDLNDALEYIEDMEISSLDELLYMELCADGTGFLRSLGEEMKIGWDDTSLWPIDDPSDKIVYTYRDNKITLTAEDYEIVLKKDTLAL